MLTNHHIASIENINGTRIKEWGEWVWKTKIEFENKIIKGNIGIIIVNMELELQNWGSWYEKLKMNLKIK